MAGRSSRKAHVRGGLGAGFACFSLLALLGFVGLVLVKARWRTTWDAVSGARI